MFQSLSINAISFITTATINQPRISPIFIPFFFTWYFSNSKSSVLLLDAKFIDYHKNMRANSAMATFLSTTNNNSQKIENTSINYKPLRYSVVLNTICSCLSTVYSLQMVLVKVKRRTKNKNYRQHANANANAMLKRCFTSFRLFELLSKMQNAQIVLAYKKLMRTSRTCKMNFAFWNTYGGMPTELWKDCSFNVQHRAFVQHSLGISHLIVGAMRRVLKWRFAVFFFSSSKNKRDSSQFCLFSGIEVRLFVTAIRNHLLFATAWIYLHPQRFISPIAQISDSIPLFLSHRCRFSLSPHHLLAIFLILSGEPSILLFGKRNRMEKKERKKKTSYAQDLSKYTFF